MIEVVSVDEKSFRGLAEPMALRHTHLGNFLRGMAGAKPEFVERPLRCGAFVRKYANTGVDREAAMLAGQHGCQVLRG